MKKSILCALLLLVALALSGCVSTLLEEKRSTDERLPEIRSGPEAPLGDGQEPWAGSAVLHVPTADASRLETVLQTVVVESGQTKQEAHVAALLRHIDGSAFNTSTQQIRLAQVSNAVETSGGLVTVNMHPSMRSLSPQEQFALRMAIINTLTELPETRYVNILVNGRDIGLDIGETIPTGVMDRYPSADIALHWSQLQAERQATGGEMEKRVALYFVSDDGKYLLGEVRKMTFAGYDPAVLAKALLEELSKGTSTLEGARTLVPPQDWFERDPVLADIDGDAYIELYFHEGVSGFLALKNSTIEMMITSICYTLTSFIPRLDGIIVYVNGERVTQMRLELMGGEPWAMENGQITRESVASMAADLCTLYYPLSNGARLYAVKRPIPQRQRAQPRALLRELMQPPRSSALSPVFPEGITDADILGIQIQEDTALINVTEAFGAACSSLTEAQERNLVYAIVNTLTEIESVSRVRFFVEGTQSPLAGGLFMGGEFMRHPGLVYTGDIPTQ